MFKLLFFFLLLFIIYKGLQFISQVYQVYERTRSSSKQQANSGQRQYKQQTNGQTTIHYNPKNGEKTRKKPNKSGDDDYIDFEEIKERT